MTAEEILRRIAEERLKARAPEILQPRREEDVQKLVHELEVHQIELEIQNEELRQARDELETLLEKYTDIYDFAPVGYFILDSDGAISSANLAGASLLGIERSRLIGRNFKLFVLDENRADFADFLDKVFTSRNEEACETTLLRWGITQLTVQIEAHADNTGQQCRIAVIDITERRQAEDALTESKERMYKLAELAIDAFVMLDDTGAVTFCNAAAERMFGFQSDTLIGRNIHRIIIPERFRDAAMRGFAHFREHGTGPVINTTTEIEALRKDGTEFPVEVSISAVKLKGKWHAIGIMRDISERKNLEYQLLQSQKMETVGLLSGGIAHDFNNILNVIIGYVFILENSIPESDPLQDNVKQISAAADRAANLTKSLLNFSRKNLINSEPTDINEIIRNVDKFLSMVIGEDIRLETACGDQILTVTADIGQIEQVLINLAANARHAMPQGGTLTVTSESFVMNPKFVKSRGFGKPGQYALITVTDTGTGMDSKTLERIFEPFFTTKTLGKGTGLGLSIVYSLVKQHEGYIYAASKPGKGTTFRIYLPLSHTRNTSKEQIPASSPNRGTETILLAEDDDALRTLTKKILLDYGYRVISVANGKEAVRAYSTNKNSIQLLLFDLIMPQKNGKEAYDKIKALCPEVKILFMSGYTADIIEAKTFLKEPEILVKPFTSIELASRVRATLDK